MLEPLTGKLIPESGRSPGLGIGAQQNAEQLLARPQFQRLKERWSGQVNVILGITHVGTNLAELGSCVCLVLACQNKC